MSRTISIITFYNPTNENVNNMLRIAEQSDIVIICDNSEESNIDLLRNVFDIFDHDKIIYHSFHKNLGLSAAFNKVLRDGELIGRLEWQNDDFVLFFDQDSLIEKNHIKLLEEEFLSLEEAKINIGCLGPAYYDTSNGKINPYFHTDTELVSAIMTSSMLTRYANLQISDFWNESIFLDMADWDLCWRMRKKGLLCFITSKVILQHTLGNRVKKIGPIKLRVGKTFREYYQIRDCLYLLRKNYVPFKYKIRFFLQLTLRSFLHVMFLDGRLERLYYIKLGIKHNLQGVIGDLPQELLFARN